MNPQRLHTILQAARSGSINYKELVEVIHYSRSMAESYLVAHRGSVLQLCDSYGISLSDLATDCIADIFRRNEDGIFIELIRFFDQCVEIDEEKRLIRYRQFIIIRTRSQLARTYAQIDGAGAKISRNIKLHLQKDERLQLKHDFRGYVIEPRSGDPLNERPAFPVTELEQALFSRLSISQSIPEILTMVAEVLCQQAMYRRSIPLFYLINVIRSVYLPQEDEVESMPDIELSIEEIAAVQRSICIELDNRIFTEYVRKEKLTFEQAKKVSMAVREIMTGWWNGVDDHESISAIAQRMLEISAQEYRTTFQTKLEYLIKQAKERFRNSLAKDL